jgi:hypothetical protein
MLSFDQSKLQDFADCPRRFYLKYIRQLHYPAPESAPLREFETHMEQGAQFHQLVHQHQIGISAEALEETIPDDQVGDWWDNYIAHALTNLPARRYPEITLSVPLAGRRLVAKYDLLALGDNRAVIMDWKTALRRPKRETLERRLQTIVYPYVLANAGAHLNKGQPLAPEAISMVYWFAEFPQQPEIFIYSADQFAKDGAALESMAADILRRTEFELTADLSRCRFCTYRSLCERGVKAGDFREDSDDESDDLDIDLDLDQIAEIEF